jgi:hypothetical protein
MLDVKKIYIDSRFKTADSPSDSDFYVELPRAMNIPDKCVCYIDDIVIPVSWTMVDDRNSQLRLSYIDGAAVGTSTLTMPSGNYNGISFSAALETLMNTVLEPVNLPIAVAYDLINNKMTVSMTDNRDDTSETPYVIIENSISFGVPLKLARSLNGVMMLDTFFEITPAKPFITYLDLHTTRNLYLTSSSLGSYNTISNFGCDVIIKKIPVRYNYNEMLFDSSEAGYDFLDVSKRMLRRIDFRLQDSFGNIINMNKNHWSFSLIFQLQD